MSENQVIIEDPIQEDLQTKPTPNKDKTNQKINLSSIEKAREDNKVKELSSSPILTPSPTKESKKSKNK